MHVIPEQARRALLQRHGDFSIAYSVAFQPDLLHFGDETGFLAYKMVGRTAFVLANPLAPPDRCERLIDDFVSLKKDVGFWQTSHQTAAMLSRRNFDVNEFGTDTVIDLADFNFDGPHRRSFRTAVNRFARSGHTMREVSIDALPAAQVKAVSEGWRKTRTTKNRELRFLVRPVVLADEPGARKFVMFDPGGSAVAFAFFDPIYRDGALLGYLAATRRRLPSVDPLAGYAIMRTAMEKFRGEGVPSLHLGLSPFHHIEDKEFRKNWLIRRGFRFMYTNMLTNRLVYPFRTLAQHKESYGGTEYQTYCAINTLPALPRLLKLLIACRII